MGKKKTYVTVFYDGEQSEYVPFLPLLNIVLP